MAFWESTLAELTGGIDALLGDLSSVAAQADPEHAAVLGGALSPLPPDMALADWGGSGAGAAAAASAALAGGHAGRVAADEQAAGALRGVAAAAERARQRLLAVRADLEDGVGARRPSLDAVGAQMEMARFLHGKAAELLAVVREAQGDAVAHSSAMSAAESTYSA